MSSQLQGLTKKGEQEQQQLQEENQHLDEQHQEQQQQKSEQQPQNSEQTQPQQQQFQRKTVKQLTKEERDYWQHRLPRGFQFYLERLARGVIRNQPSDIFSFAAVYLDELLVNRNAELWKLPLEPYFVKLYKKRIGQLPWRSRKSPLKFVVRRELSPISCQVFPDIVVKEYLPESPAPYYIDKNCSESTTPAVCESIDSSEERDEAQNDNAESHEMYTADDCQCSETPALVKEETFDQLSGGADNETSSTCYFYSTNGEGPHSSDSANVTLTSAMQGDDCGEANTAEATIAPTGNISGSECETLRQPKVGDAALLVSPTLEGDQCKGNMLAGSPVQTGNDIMEKVQINTKVVKEGSFRGDAPSSEIGCEERDGELTDKTALTGKKIINEQNSKSDSTLGANQRDEGQAMLKLGNSQKQTGSGTALDDDSNSKGVSKISSATCQELFSRAEEQGIRDIYVPSFDHVNNMEHQTKYYQNGPTMESYSRRGDEGTDVSSATLRSAAAEGVVRGSPDSSERSEFSSVSAKGGGKATLPTGKVVDTARTSQEQIKGRKADEVKTLDSKSRGDARIQRAAQDVFYDANSQEEGDRPSDRVISGSKLAHESIKGDSGNSGKEEEVDVDDYVEMISVETECTLEDQDTIVETEYPKSVDRKHSQCPFGDDMNVDNVLGANSHHLEVSENIGGSSGSPREGETNITNGQTWNNAKVDATGSTDDAENVPYFHDKENSACVELPQQVTELFTLSNKASKSESKEVFPNSIEKSNASAEEMIAEEVVEKVTRDPPDMGSASIKVITNSAMSGLAKARATETPDGEDDNDTFDPISDIGTEERSLREDAAGDLSDSPHNVLKSLPEASDSNPSILSEHNAGQNLEAAKVYQNPKHSAHSLSGLAESGHKSGSERSRQNKKEDVSDGDATHTYVQEKIDQHLENLETTIRDIDNVLQKEADQPEVNVVPVGGAKNLVGMETTKAVKELCKLSKEPICPEGLQDECPCADAAVAENILHDGAQQTEPRGGRKRQKCPHVQDSDIKLRTSRAIHLTKRYIAKLEKVASGIEHILNAQKYDTMQDSDLDVRPLSKSDHRRGKVAMYAGKDEDGNDAKGSKTYNIPAPEREEKLSVSQAFLDKISYKVVDLLDGKEGASKSDVHKEEDCYEYSQGNVAVKIRTGKEEDCDVNPNKALAGTVDENEVLPCNSDESEILCHKSEPILSSRHKSTRHLYDNAEELCMPFTSSTNNNENINNNGNAWSTQSKTHRSFASWKCFEHTVKNSNELCMPFYASTNNNENINNNGNASSTQPKTKGTSPMDGSKSGSDIPETVPGKGQSFSRRLKSHKNDILIIDGPNIYPVSRTSIGNQQEEEHKKELSAGEKTKQGSKTHVSPKRSHVRREKVFVNTWQPRPELDQDQYQRQVDKELVVRADDCIVNDTTNHTVYRIASASALSTPSSAANSTMENKEPGQSAPKLFSNTQTSTAARESRSSIQNRMKSPRPNSPEGMGSVPPPTANSTEAKSPKVTKNEVESPSVSSPSLDNTTEKKYSNICRLQKSKEDCEGFEDTEEASRHNNICRISRRKASFERSKSPSFLRSRRGQKNRDEQNPPKEQKSDPGLSQTRENDYINSSIPAANVRSAVLRALLFKDTIPTPPADDGSTMKGKIRPKEMVNDGPNYRIKKKNFPLRVRAFSDANDNDDGYYPEWTRRLTIESPMENYLVHTTYVRPNPHIPDMRGDFEVTSQKRRLYLDEKEDFIDTDGTRRLICETECFTSKDPERKQIVVENGTMRVTSTKIKGKRSSTSLSDENSNTFSARLASIVSHITKGKSSFWIKNNYVGMVGNFVLIGAGKHVSTIKNIVENQEKSADELSKGAAKKGSPTVPVQNRKSGQVNSNVRNANKTNNNADQLSSIQESSVGFLSTQNSSNNSDCNDGNKNNNNDKSINNNNCINNSRSTVTVSSRCRPYQIRRFDSDYRQPSKRWRPLCREKTSLVPQYEKILRVALRFPNQNVTENLVSHNTTSNCAQALSGSTQPFLTQPLQAYAFNKPGSLRLEDSHTLKYVCGAPRCNGSSSICSKSLLYNTNNNSQREPDRSDYEDCTTLRDVDQLPTEHHGDATLFQNSRTTCRTLKCQPLSGEPCGSCSPPPNTEEENSMLHDDFQIQVQAGDINPSIEAQTGNSLSKRTPALPKRYPIDMETRKAQKFHPRSDCATPTECSIATEPRIESATQVQTGDICPSDEMQTGFPRELKSRCLRECISCCETRQKPRSSTRLKHRNYETGSQVTVDDICPSNKVQTGSSLELNPPFDGRTERTDTLDWERSAQIFKYDASDCVDNMCSLSMSFATQAPKVIETQVMATDINATNDAQTGDSLFQTLPFAPPRPEVSEDISEGLDTTWGDLSIYEMPPEFKSVHAYVRQYEELSQRDATDRVMHPKHYLNTTGHESMDKNQRRGQRSRDTTPPGGKGQSAEKTGEFGTSYDGGRSGMSPLERHEARREGMYTDMAKYNHPATINHEEGEYMAVPHHRQSITVTSLNDSLLDDNEYEREYVPRANRRHVLTVTEEESDNEDNERDDGSNDQASHFPYRRRRRPNDGPSTGTQTSSNKRIY